MNISPQAPSLSIPTVVNPPTESLRRENSQREVIAAPAAASRSAAEKGVASDKERGRTPAQNSEQIDFVNLEKRAKQEKSSISDQNSSSDENSSKQQENNTEQEPSENTFESFAEERVISELQSRDKEVRAHEFAHAAVGGASTGAPSYSYQKGPDGKQCAVNGEVSVDLSTVSGNPRATIAKMQKVHSAALAPANPSAQDRSVAATASQIIQRAQSELFTEQSEQASEIKTSSQFTKPRSVFQKDDSVDKAASDSNDFDTLINQTLAAQEQIAPGRTQDVVERAGRVESFYSNITQAYEKPPSFQFELTA
jgi:hypothetical protein